MYYHTCPYCGANLDPANTVTAYPASLGNHQSGTAWMACERRVTSGLAVSALKLGIGVFPLAASRCGTVPVWASEIARALVSITKRHFLKCCIWAISRR